MDAGKGMQGAGNFARKRDSGQFGTLIEKTERPVSQIGEVLRLAWIQWDSDG
jgi:hypothetical protein